jgi:hypothetical protein
MRQRSQAGKCGGGQGCASRRWKRAAQQLPLQPCCLVLHCAVLLHPTHPEPYIDDNRSPFPPSCPPFAPLSLPQFAALCRIITRRL